MVTIFGQSNSKDFTGSLFAQNPDFYNLGKSHVTKFANGELTVVLEESVRGNVIVIVAQPTNYDHIFELLSTIDAAKRSSAKEIIAVIPNLPHSRQERRAEGVRTSISARLFADLLQTAGLNRLITMDVHTTAIEGFYSIPFDNLVSFDNFIDKIKSLDLDDYMVVSPDFGGMKRAKKFAKELNVDLAVLSKERLIANKVSDMTLIGDVEGRNVLIFDDMIDTGGTLLEAAKILKENGAKKIIIFAVHGILSNDAEVKLVSSENIDSVYITNTIPLRLGYYRNLDVIDVSNLFDTALLKILNNKK